jgi:hypothetical protein
MGLFSFIREAGTPQDMAKRQDIDVTRVDTHVQRLTTCGTDKSAFDMAFAELLADKSLSAPEVQAVAMGYSGGSKKPANRKVALSSIVVRFAERVGAIRKNEIAAKVRPL